MAILLHRVATVRTGSRRPVGASDITEHLGQVIADILENCGDSQTL